MSGNNGRQHASCSAVQSATSGSEMHLLEWTAISPVSSLALSLPYSIDRRPAAVHASSSILEMNSGVEMTNESQRILVVEDEQDLGVAIRATLERQGWGVVVAHSARDAFDLVASEPFPSVILLDLALPDLGGDEFLREVRQDPRLEHIPVIVMSACSITPPVPIAGWLPKPFESKQLIEMIDRLLPMNAAASPI